MLARNMVDAHLFQKWQTRWDTARTGRHTYEFFPNVRERLKCRWIRPSHHVTQLLTGHGSFRFKLHALGLIEDPQCNCHQPEEDTVQHVLYTCTKYNAFRRPLQEVAQIRDVVWPPEFRFWAKKDTYPVFRKYVTRVIRLREEEELRRLQAR